MYTKLLITFSAFAVVGVLFTFILFRQDKNEKKGGHFITSERLIIFLVEILIAVIGFGVTLAITNANERQLDKEKAIQMMEQTIAYTDKQIVKERSYLNMYDDGDIEANVFLNSSVVNTNYYESILTNELILQNANMNIHGDVMTYLIWIEEGTARAKEAPTEKKMRSEMYWRYAYFIKLRNLLATSYDEMTGVITTEQAQEKRDAIHHRSLNDTVKLHEKTEKK